MLTQIKLSAQNCASPLARQRWLYQTIYRGNKGMRFWCNHGFHASNEGPKKNMLDSSSDKAFAVKLTLNLMYAVQQRSYCHLTTNAVCAGQSLKGFLYLDHQGITYWFEWHASSVRRNIWVNLMLCASGPKIPCCTSRDVFQIAYNILLLHKQNIDG